MSVNLPQNSQLCKTCVIARKFKLFQYSVSISHQIFDEDFPQFKRNASQNILKTKKSHSEKRDTLAFNPIINFLFLQNFSTNFFRNVNTMQAKTFWKRKNQHSEKRDKLALEPIINFRFSTKIYKYFRWSFGKYFHIFYAQPLCAIT